MSRIATAVLIGSVVFLVARSAPADEHEPRVREWPEAVHTIWYGWQTLAADTASVLLISFVGADGLAWTGTVFALHAPIVHVFHQNWIAVAASVAIRAPVAALFTWNEHYGTGADAYAVLGGGVLLIAGAVVVDAAVFAYDHRRLEGLGGVSVAPVVALDHQSGLVGVRGVF